MKITEQQYGNYALATAALTLEEEGALFRFWSFHSVLGRPIPNDSRYRVSGAHTESERASADSILNTFFNLEGDGWVLSEADWNTHQRSPKWSTEHYQEALERDGSICRYCESQENLEIDHIIPRCAGGSDAVGNLAVCCRSCNAKKGGRTPGQAGMTLLDSRGLQ